MNGLVRMGTLTLAVLPSACQTMTAKKVTDTTQAPSCGGVTPLFSQVEAAVGHTGMVAAACSWCGLSDKERRRFTKEEAKALRNATPGKAVNIESPEHGTEAFMLLDIENVSSDAPGKQCVTYTETIHWGGKESKRAKRACECIKNATT